MIPATTAGPSPDTETKQNKTTVTKLGDSPSPGHVWLSPEPEWPFLLLYTQREGLKSPWFLQGAGCYLQVPENDPGGVWGTSREELAFQLMILCLLSLPLS